MTASTAGSPNSHRRPQLFSRGRLGVERMQSLFTSLVTPLVPVDYLEMIDPLRFSRSLRGRVESVIDETANARSLVIRPGRGWVQHRAGQFVRLAADIDGVRHTRCYSISSAPERDDGCFTITVKTVDGGKVSGHLVGSLSVGTLLHLAPADGEFVLPTADVSQISQKLLFVTAGSGITPVMSMLRSFAARNSMPDVTLLHYAPTTEEIIFGDELLALAKRFPNLRLCSVTTREAANHSLRGHFDSVHLNSVCTDWRMRSAFICGPAALLDTAQSIWREAGVESRLVIERFQPAMPASNAGAVGGEVRFGRSGRLAQTDGAKPLLEVAESAGLHPSYGCRMGICHGCTVKLKSGCVRDLRTGKTHSDADELIQICVCAAAGDIELEL